MEQGPGYVGGSSVVTFPASFPAVDLSPLEIGLHALESVTLGNRWSENGGLKEYAENIGRAPSKITEYRQAAEVFRDLDSHGEDEASVKFPRGNLIDKARHLSEIHKSPSSLWPILVRAMLDIAAKYLLPAEEEKARERQATSTGGDEPQLVENLPEAGGRARDLAAAQVGLSGKTVDAKKGGSA